MSEEFHLESNQFTFNEEEFNNVQAAFMREESEDTAESQQYTNSDDEGLLKVLSYDSEVNISSALPKENVNISSQSCETTTINIKKPVPNTYQRKRKREIDVAVGNNTKKKVRKNKLVRSLETNTLPPSKNKNIIKVSDIKNSESHLDEEDEYTLNKIKENLHNLGSKNEMEIFISDSVSSKTTVRKQGRPKKKILEVKKTGKKSQITKNIILTSKNSQGKGKSKVGSTLKKNNVKVPVEDTHSTTVPLIEASNTQSPELDSTNKFEHLRDVHNPIIDDLNKTLGELDNNIITDSTAFNSKTDDVCSNNLKEGLTETEEKQTEKVQLDVNNDDLQNTNCSKRLSRMPVKPDFQYNIDNLVKESTNKATENELSDSKISGRPQRRKFKHNLCYDEFSDEDPFANVELSNDSEPINFKKRNRYNSDDEYIPTTKPKQKSYSSDSDIDKNEDDLKKQKKRKYTKSKKKEKKLSVDTLDKDTKELEHLISTQADNSQPDENNELCSENQNKRSTVNKDQTCTFEDKSEEIENYLARKIQGTNLKIKRISNIEPTAIIPFEIPVIDSFMSKKCVHACSQTNVLKTTSTSVQTTAGYDLGMKINVPLTITQSEKACEFFNDILKMFSGLGQLMTQKSEDFIQKKINTKHVNDTFKLDYYVRKSFLLFKLAKHNLLELEGNFAKQYEDFLKENNLLQYREVPKSITPTLVLSESDSDCEIIEESTDSYSNWSKEKSQPQLNLKTLFLNKELSIKMAKKPSEEQKSKEKINIKGKTTMWINDSVLLKKISSKQSFLAQDHRNKKPPDKYVTNKMVSDFFEKYRHTVLTICAPFITPENSGLKTINTCCYYFSVESTKLNSTLKHIQHSESMNVMDINHGSGRNEPSTYNVNSSLKNIETLLSLCLNVLQKNMFYLTKKPINFEGIKHKNDDFINLSQNNDPLRLSVLCLHAVRNIFSKKNLKQISKSKSIRSISLNIVSTLKILCYNKIIGNLYKPVDYEIEKMQSKQSKIDFQKCRPITSLASRIVKYRNKSRHDKSHVYHKEVMKLNFKEKNKNDQLQHPALKSLKQITYSFLSHFIIVHEQKNAEHLNVQLNKNFKHVNLTTSEQIIEIKDQLQYYSLKSLKHIAFSYIVHTMIESDDRNAVLLNNIKNNEPYGILTETLATKNKLLEIEDQLKIYTPKSLKHVHKLRRSEKRNDEKLNNNKKSEPFKIHRNLLLTKKQFVERNHDLKSLQHFAFTTIMQIMKKTKHGNTGFLSKNKTSCSLNREILENNKLFKKTSQDKHFHHIPKSLKHITYLFIKHFMKHNKNDFISCDCKINNTYTRRKKNMKQVEDVDQSRKQSEKIREMDSKLYNLELRQVKSLFEICCKKVNLLIGENKNVKELTIGSIHINSVNSIPNELFLNFKNHSLYSKEDHNEINVINEANIQNKYLVINNHENKIFFQEYCENKQKLNEATDCFNQYTDYGNIEQGENSNYEFENTNFLSEIKTEPLENVDLNNKEAPFIKSELGEIFEETIIMPHIKNTNLKYENFFDSVSIMTEKPDNSYTGQNFAKLEKLENKKQTMNGNPNELVFSQSSLRVRKQFEPDSDNETENTMSLLIPQTYESLLTNTTQNMFTNNNSAKVLIGIQTTKLKRKKNDKQKIKPKSLTTKKKSTEEHDKLPIKEIYEIIENKTTNEEERVQSSDSDTINIPLRNRIQKLRKCKRNFQKQRVITMENEIQCNNVDSTQNISENNESITYNAKTEANNFDGNSEGLEDFNNFCNDMHSKTKSSTNESDLKIKSYNKTDNLQLHKQTEDSDRSFSPGIDPDAIVELLCCEPDIPQFTYDIKHGNKAPTNKHNKEIIKSVESEPCDKQNESDKSLRLSNIPKWHLYISSNDIKLHQEPVVILERLPGKFVKTCLQFQESSKKNKNVAEDERFLPQCFHKTMIPFDNENIGYETISDCIVTDVNLQQHPKTTSLDYCDINNDIKNDGELDNFSLVSNMPNSKNGVLTSAISEERCDDEISLSKEEEDVKSVEKFSHDALFKSSKHFKSGDKYADDNTSSESPKSTTKASNCDNLLMLTADKVMNNDLKLINEPILAHDDYNEEMICKSAKKNYRKRIARCTTKKDTTCMEDHSSSEDEKQWVNTKEKLLKKLLKKQEDTRLDEAKTEKLVNEFIEKCESPEPRKRYHRSRNVRTQKNITERQKQLYVLSKELFGETSEQSLTLRENGFQYFGKGRHNIRKVIDKKSLARSTVITNMEENERKRRINQRLIAMREALGCEEDVNVVVINDELCLEYDCEENMPVVSIHNFFTSVMKAHQYEGVKFMWDACFESLAKVEAGHAGGGCILAHCMGLGKTLQVLALLHTVLTHPRVNMHRVLVCCPLSAVLNWVDEVHKWMKPVTDKIKVFELSKLKKIHERAYQLEDWYNSGGIFIIGYELFRNLTTLDPLMDKIHPPIVDKIRKVLLNPGPDIIICDEGHLLKNDSSVLAIAMSRIATKRRIILTGTPMQNNLREYFCMVNFVKPNLLGRYSEFSNRFENPIINGQHRDSGEEDIKLMKARTHILHKVLEGVMQRQEASVLYPYLPKKHEYTVFIPLSKCQCDLYKHYLTHYTHDKHNTLKDFHVLQKIWTHPQVLHNFYLKLRGENTSKVEVDKTEDDLACEDLSANEDIKPIQTEMWWSQYLEEGKLLNTLQSSNKFLIVFRILEECFAFDDKVLLFSTSLFTLDTLEYFLKKIHKWSLGREYYRLDGSVPVEVRQKWCRDFNAESNKATKLFLLSTRAGSLGLNMTAANRVIIFDTSWNPAHDMQSIFRVYRFGQKKDCYIYRLVALGTMEQKIYERSVTKQAVSCRVVDAQPIDRHYNMDELTELYKFDETGAGVASGVAVGVTDVALLRVARDSPLHAVHEHDSLLRGSEEQQLPEHERAAAWQQFEQEQEDKQIENLVNSSHKTTTKRPHEHDNAEPTTSQTIDTNSKEEYVPQAKINCLNELEDSTSEEKKYDENDEQNDEGTDETKVIKPINNNFERENVSSDYEKINIEHMVNKMRNIVEAQLRNLSVCNKDTSSDKNSSIQLTSNNVATFKVVHTAKENHEGHEPLDTCSEIEINNKNFKSNIEMNKNDTHNVNNRKRCNNNKETLSDTRTDNNTIVIVTAKKKTKLFLHLEQKVSSDDDDVCCMDDDSNILSPKLDKQQENGSQEKFNDDKVILLSDAETITDNEDQGQESIAIPDKVHSKLANNDIDVNCILLSDDEDVDVNVATNQSEVKTIDITESNDDKANNDDNEVIYLPKLLLMNKHFIKIVENTYLKNNPKLTENKARVAAKYSIQEALKESSKTGIDLCSGPIYDIAVNTLGKVVLKKIQSANNGKATKTETDQSQRTFKETPSKDLVSSNQTNIDLTSDDESLMKPNKSEKTIYKGTIRRRVRERLGSSSSDDLIMIPDQPETPVQNKIEKPNGIVYDLLATRDTKSKRTKSKSFASTLSSIEILPESPSTSRSADHIKASTTRIRNVLRGNDDYNRPSTSAGVGKAKKRRSCYSNDLTQEDFDIDDIDNIVELE